MKVLIVGGAGYIGGCMTDYLVEKGYDVTVYDSLIYEDRYLKPVNFIFGDIRDREKLDSILPDYDTVIWLAAIVGDGACAVDRYLSQAINEDAVKWLVDHYNGKIVFMSTCSVYGANDQLVDEDSPVNPLSVYGITKYRAEQYIIANAKDYLIFRLGTLYGMGDYYSRVRLDLVANILVTKAVLGEKLTVFGGEQWRPLLHVKDVATATEYGLEKDIRGMYVLSSGNYQITDIAKEIQSIISGTEIVFQDMPFEDMRNYKVDFIKWTRKGWKPSYSLAIGVAEMSHVIGQHRLKNSKSPLYSNEYYLGANIKPL